MNFIISANTDIGTTKSVNQDSVSMKVINTRLGRMAFGVLCDGMGGLAKGEVASASVIKAFDTWARVGLKKICETELNDMVIREQWTSIVMEQNRQIKEYGAKFGTRLGTTVTAVLLTQTRYYILNVGDSRAYEIFDSVRQITRDHSFVAREVAMGRMTQEQAEKDDRRNVLLQCVGATEENQLNPELFFGAVREGAVYMLCSDGFRHEICSDEIFEKLSPDVLFDEYKMSRNSRALIELNKQRSETDNITVALIRTF